MMVVTERLWIACNSQKRDGPHGRAVNSRIASVGNVVAHLADRNSRGS